MAESDIRVVVFDLDDTLYCERDFAAGGFAAVARHLEDTRGTRDFAGHCLQLLDSGRRGDIFDRALDLCGVDPCEVDMGELVAIYRGHDPEIALAPDAGKLLAALAAPSALITDGPEAMQRAKIAALGLDTRIDFVLPTASFGPGFGKPHHRAFAAVEAWSGLPGCCHVYVADNAAKDFIAPKARGWITVQLLRPERIHDGSAPGPDHAADHLVESLLDLPSVLPGALFSAAEPFLGLPADTLPADHHP